MNDIGALGTTDAVRAAASVEHYQKTMELVVHHYERRSRQFVTLVAVLAGAALVAFSRPIIAPALEATFLKYVPLTGAGAERLRELTPFAGDLLLGFLVITVFYLTANLVNRSTVIANYYAYLERIEPEIRSALRLPSGQYLFTREGAFYSATGAETSRLIALCYRGILGFLLVFFFAARLFFDYPAGVSLPGLDRGEILTFVAKVFLFVVDVLVVLPTIILYLRFVRLRPMSESEIRARMKTPTEA
jgi:hypothetical protein